MFHVFPVSHSSEIDMRAIMNDSHLASLDASLFSVLEPIYRGRPWNFFKSWSTWAGNVRNFSKSHGLYTGDGSEFFQVPKPRRIGGKAKSFSQSHGLSQLFQNWTEGDILRVWWTYSLRIETDHLVLFKERSDSYYSLVSKFQLFGFFARLRRYSLLILSPQRK